MSGSTDASRNRVNKARGVNLPFAEYLTSVNNLMSQRAAFRYLDQHKSLNGDLEHLRDSFDRGVAPDDFVENIISTFGMARVMEDSDAADVAQRNRVKAAICEFAMGANDWHLHSDGHVLRAVDGGMVMISPVKQSGGRNYGFGVSLHIDGSLVDNRLSGVSRVEALTASFDLDEALASFERDFSNEGPVLKFG